MVTSLSAMGESVLTMTGKYMVEYIWASLIVVAVLDSGKN